MTVETRVCEICGSTHARRIEKFSISPWPVVACETCGFVYLRTVPGYEALVETYAWEKTFAEEKARRKARSWSRFDQATRWRLRFGKSSDVASRAGTLGRSGRVLEVGCGGSCRLHEGVTPYGIEISAALAERSRPQFQARGGDVVCAPATEGLDQFEDGFFDSILMRSYLEHEQKPREVLTKAFRKLRPGGTIFARVPNFGSVNRHVTGAKWCGFRFPDHVNYFTDSSLKALSSSIGFSYRRKNWASLFDDNLIVELRKPAGGSQEMRARA